MEIEDALQRTIFSNVSEKTFIDKVLARDDVMAIRDIVKKERLTRADMLEILNLLSSTEAKLLNYGLYDRYIILKFFVWIREFIKVAELLFDFKDIVEAKSIMCMQCGGIVLSVANKDYKVSTSQKLCICQSPKIEIIMTDRMKNLLDNNMRLIEHNAKFLIDLYLNIGRTSLSIGATGLLEMLKNKFEIAYPLGRPDTSQPQGQQVMAIKKS